MEGGGLNILWIFYELATVNNGTLQELLYERDKASDREELYRFDCDMSPLGIFCGKGHPTPGSVDYKQLGARLAVEPNHKEIKSAKKQSKKDAKRAKHKAQIKYTTVETGAIAAGSAALAAFAAAAITKALSKKNK